MNNRKTVMTVFALALAMLFSSALAFADPGQAEIDFDEQRDAFVYTSSDQTLEVDAGQVTSVNLSTQMSTYRWAGLLGGVSGNLILGDDDENVLFNWTAVGQTVFASTSGAPTWSDLEAGTVADIEGEFPHTASGSDNASATFDSTEDFTTPLFGTIANAARAVTLDNSGASVWETFALRTAPLGDVFFAGVVRQQEEAYSGEDVDFQMILPEDGQGFTTGTTYNLWVELQ